MGSPKSEVPRRVIFNTSHITSHPIPSHCITAHPITSHHATWHDTTSHDIATNHIARPHVTSKPIRWHHSTFRHHRKTRFDCCPSYHFVTIHYPSHHKFIAHATQMLSLITTYHKKCTTTHPQCVESTTPALKKKKWDPQKRNVTKCCLPRKTQSRETSWAHFNGQRTQLSPHPPRFVKGTPLLTSWGKMQAIEKTKIITNLMMTCLIHTLCSLIFAKKLNWHGLTGVPIQSKEDCQCSPGYGFVPATGACSACVKGEYKARALTNAWCEKAQLETLYKLQGCSSYSWDCVNDVWGWADL